MTQMCGIGPFVTIPLMIAALGGPQAVFGWIVGALLALVDGLVWAELGAAMPGAGGTYLCLREAFQYRTGRLMPFLFVWTAMFTIPLIMSTGVIGLVQYLGHLVPGMSWVAVHAISLAIVALVVFALYRRVAVAGAISTVLWVIALLSLLIVIVASLTHFHASLALTYPQKAFAFGGPFWAGLGGGLLIGIYDYLGYNTTAYMAAELKDPRPRPSVPYPAPARADGQGTHDQRPAAYHSSGPVRAVPSALRCLSASTSPTTKRAIEPERCASRTHAPWL
jgi:amino acid transporter